MGGAIFGRGSARVRACTLEPSKTWVTLKLCCHKCGVARAAEICPLLSLNTSDPPTRGSFLSVLVNRTQLRSSAYNKVAHTIVHANISGTQVPAKAQSTTHLTRSFPSPKLDSQPHHSHQHFNRHRKIHFPSGHTLKSTAPQTPRKQIQTVTQLPLLNCLTSHPSPPPFPLSPLYPSPPSPPTAPDYSNTHPYSANPPRYPVPRPLAPLSTPSTADHRVTAPTADPLSTHSREHPGRVPEEREVLHEFSEALA